jgi:glycosyltransferase involved in cell wall biosynthesis
MVVETCYPFAELRVQRQAEALALQGHLVDVICRRFQDEPIRERIGGVTVHRLTVKGRKGSVVWQMFDYLTFACLAFLKVTCLHIRHRFDVVQVHNLPDFLVFCAIVPRLTGSRIILDIHDLMPEFYCSRFKKSFNSLPVYLLRWQESLSCWFSHHVITVTDVWKETLVRRGVPSRKCFVVMNLPDPAYFDPSLRSKSSDERSSDKGRAFRLIYHGTITSRYGIDLLLKAVQLLKSEIPNIHLRIHGRGDYVNAVHDMINDLLLSDHVEFTTHFLSSHALSELIQSADVGVVPYRRDIFTDGILPTKLLEYVALGIPVVVARTSVVSHYLGEDLVEYFDPENVSDLALHIIRLYRDEDRRKLLIRNSEVFNGTYNWSSQKSAYIRFIQNPHEIALSVLERPGQT